MTTIASSEPNSANDDRTQPQTGPALPAPIMSPAPHKAPDSLLGPAEDFPEDLVGLGMTELQVLHSRITRQLDHDYLTDPIGPHCWTLDQCHELDAEPDARDTARDHLTQLRPLPTGTP